MLCKSASSLLEAEGHRNTKVGEQSFYFIFVCLFLKFMTKVIAKANDWLIMTSLDNRLLARVKSARPQPNMSYWVSHLGCHLRYLPYWDFTVERHTHYIYIYIYTYIYICMYGHSRLISSSQSHCFVL